uniref:LysM peptidoglycan-binding domain-containing protein n=1 Tax=Agathobacter sp. TaxID=2021311 RepID=UPI0040574FA3
MEVKREAYNAGMSVETKICMKKRTMAVHLPKSAIMFILLLTVCFIVLFGTGISVFANSKANQEPTYKYYKSVRIEEGDTLWSIAGEHMDGVNMGRNEYIEEIRTLNNLNLEGDICTGDYLIVFYYSNELK